MKADQFTKSILDLDNDIMFSGVIEKSGTFKCQQSKGFSGQTSKRKKCGTDYF